MRATRSSGGRTVLDLNASFQMVEREDDKRLADIRRKQKKVHWLQKTASRELGLNYRQLLRWDSKLDDERSPAILKRAMSDRLTPELRWALAYRIRRSNSIFDMGVARSLAHASGLEHPDDVDHMRVFTATTEDMQADEDAETMWVRRDTPTVSWETQPGFTGQLDVIVDMESDLCYTGGGSGVCLDAETRTMVLDGKNYGAMYPSMNESPFAGFHGDVLIEAVEESDTGDSYATCLFEPVEVAMVLDFLERSKACRVFNEVDGRQAKYLWDVDHWNAMRYPIVMSRYEKEQVEERMRRGSDGDWTNGVS